MPFKPRLTGKKLSALAKKLAAANPAKAQKLRKAIVQDFYGEKPRTHSR